MLLSSQLPSLSALSIQCWPQSVQFSSFQLLSHVRVFATPWMQHARPPCPSPTPGVHSDSHPSSQWCHPAISSSVVPFSSCPQSLPALESFPMSNSSHEVAKVLEFQLQHQSFQWTPRTDLLQNGLVGSACSPRDSQESSPTPQFKSINSSALSLVQSPTLTSIHDHWKNHSLDYRLTKPFSWPAEVKHPRAVSQFHFSWPLCPPSPLQPSEFLCQYCSAHPSIGGSPIWPPAGPQSSVSHPPLRSSLSGMGNTPHNTPAQETLPRMRHPGLKCEHIGRLFLSTPPPSLLQQQQGSVRGCPPKTSTTFSSPVPFHLSFPPP